MSFSTKWVFGLLVYGVISFVLNGTVIAQSGYHVVVHVENYSNDTLLLGNYFGRAQYVKDTALRKDNHFVFEGEEPLTPGMYMILMQPDHQFVQVIIEKNEQNFEVQFDYRDIQNSLKFEHAPSNDHFLEYVRFLSSLRPRAEAIKTEMSSGDLSDEKKASLESQLLELDKMVKSTQDSLVRKHPNEFISVMIRSQKEVEIPDFAASGDSLQQLRYAYYFDHYWQNTDLSDIRLLYSPFLFEKVTTYVEKMTPQIPELINSAIDTVLKKLQPGTEGFKYFLAYFINAYSRSEYIGMDAIFVHLVKQYYEKGLAPWVGEENLSKMVKEAHTLDPILIGKVAPDITVYDSLGQAISLHAIKANILVLIFWAPDCGHCKKSMPEVIDFYKKYKDKGVKVLAICTKLMDKEKTCWDMVHEKGMDVFYNASDKYLQSRFKQIYDVKKTPKIFVLDQDKIIISKNIGPKQLGTLMGKLLAEQ